MTTTTTMTTKAAVGPCACGPARRPRSRHCDHRPPLTLLPCALGGEGGGVLAEWVYGAALCAGHPAPSASIPGVAQRTGATTCCVEIHPAPAARLGGRRPVLGSTPVPGAIGREMARWLAYAMAQCGRLLKGSGSTDERGKANLLHIVNQLAQTAQPAAERAGAVRAAREAALADEAGAELDQVQLAQGAAQRPPREQVVRFYRRRSAA